MTFQLSGKQRSPLSQQHALAVAWDVVAALPRTGDSGQTLTGSSSTTTTTALARINQSLYEWLIAQDCLRSSQAFALRRYSPLKDFVSASLYSCNRSLRRSNSSILRGVRTAASQRDAIRARPGRPNPRTGQDISSIWKVMTLASQSHNFAGPDCWGLRISHQRHAQGTILMTMVAVQLLESSLSTQLLLVPKFPSLFWMHQHRRASIPTKQSSSPESDHPRVSRPAKCAQSTEGRAK